MFTYSFPLELQLHFIFSYICSLLASLHINQHSQWNMLDKIQMFCVRTANGPMNKSLGFVDKHRKQATHIECRRGGERERANERKTAANTRIQTKKCPIYWESSFWGITRTVRYIDLFALKRLISKHTSIEHFSQTVGCWLIFISKLLYMLLSWKKST